MSKNLLIVESPAKSGTLKKYLGKDFDILASYGHVRDLIPKTGAIDTDNDFAMKYQIIERNEKHVKKIVTALKKADTLYLATDPDREGEAISWHLYELLKEQGALEGKKVERVVFHEITKKAVLDAVANPRALSMEMVDAQQARRALDYLVGFNLSPLLWKKIHRGLSAGRVQSPALRMIAEREEEIKKFDSKEYWTIESDLEKSGQAFMAKLRTYHGSRLEQFTINNEADAQKAVSAITAAAAGSLLISHVKKSQRKRNPSPPFITSTLQQEAARKLGLSTRNTMRIAQQLYEGFDLGDGPQGLITYMRTDSVSLAQDALNDIRQTIEQRYGKDNLPDEPRFFKTKSKNAQEAHEAIRPTSAAITPSEAKKHLNTEQARLYELIWKRSIACQMVHATLNTVSADLDAGDKHSFRATGSSIKHAGFMAVYMEGSDNNKARSDKDEKMLPDLVEGEKIKLDVIRPEQHFTEPPPRYTEASLVKTLEEYGIGRPSTYANIISTLLNREYVELETKRFYPTDVGKIVNHFLTKHFTDYVDYDFTARMEDDLDEISRGEKQWLPVLKSFWGPFKVLVDDKEENVTREEAAQARQLGTDPKSGKPVSVRLGRYGPFVQIGTKDDEDKPKFASLRPGQKMDDLDLESSLELFNLPRDLGESPEGEAISTNFGRFGPYVKYDSKFVSLQEGDDPYTITLERAMELVKEKKEIDANRIIKNYEEEGIQVLNGRYGPYITDGKKNAKIPKDVEPAELDLETCQKILAEAPEKRGRGKKKTVKKKTAKKKTTKKKTTKKKSTRKKAVKKKTAGK